MTSWLEQLAVSFQEAVVSGPLLAALPVAVVAGVVSFASPCVLPLVPGYLGFVGGMAGAEPADARRGRLLGGVLLFVAGFSVVFVALSVAFSWLGLALLPWQEGLTRLAGVLVVILGLAFLGRVPFLQRERRLHLSPRSGLLGAPLLGATFGLGWAPCIGPTLAAVLSLSYGGADPVRGALLALAYCAGLGVPFIFAALAFGRSAGSMGALRRHRLAISRVGGAVLVGVGLALVSGLWGVWVGRLQGLVDGYVTVV